MKRVYMKIFIILSLFLIPVVLAAAETPDAGDEAVIHFGISSRSFETVNRNDASAALKAWTAMVIREQKLQEKAEVTLYDSFEELRKAFLQDRLDATSITSDEAMRLEVHPEAVFLPATDQGYFVRYAILVRRDSAIRDQGGFKGCKLVIPGNQRMVLARPWLETLIAGYAKGPIDPWLQELSTTESASKAILQVYFRQAQCALITLDAFDLACELNPQLRKELDILFVSPPFIPAFFMFRTAWQGPSRQRIEAAIMALHTTPGGRQVLTVFQSSRMDKQPGAILEPTMQFLAEYRRSVADRLPQGAQP